MFRSVASIFALVAFMLFTSVGSAAVITVNIDDLADAPSVSSPDNVVFTILNDTTADFLHFEFQSGITGTLPVFRKDLLEAASGPLSDRVLFTLLAGGIMDVQFDSRDVILLPAIGVDLGATVETGSFQQLWSVGDVITDNSVFFNGRSDVDTVPEPASLALLSLGLAGLGFSRRKKP